MQLVLWTADKTANLQRVVAPQLKAAGVDYRIEPLTDALPTFAVGEVVLCMGSKAVQVLQAHGLVQKGRTLGSLRYPHLVSLPGGAEALCTYAAAIVDRDYEMYVDLLVDLGTVLRRVKTGSWKPKLGTYRYVNDLSDAINWIKSAYAQSGQPIEVALDLETLGLNPYAPAAYIVSAQVSYRDKFTDVLHFSSKEAESQALGASSQLREQLEWLLNTGNVTLRGANLKYDLIWLWVKAKLECKNFKLDTTIVGSLVDENRGNSLNLHTKIYAPELGGYDDEFNKKFDKGRMDKVPLQDLLDYGGGDADATRRVAQRLKTELLQDKPLANFYVNVLHPASRAYEHVERTGICVDVPYYLELEHELKKDIARLEKDAFKIMGGRICAKYADNLKLSRAKILQEFMFGKLGLGLTPKVFTPKSKEPSTAVEHLLTFASDPKAKAFIDVFQEWSVYTKALGTYVCKRDADGKIVKGFLLHLREDNRFHPSYFFYNGYEDDEDETEGGTNTGRLSAKAPAIQTVPKHKNYAKKLRRAFIAPPGFVFLSNDYSQGELKIAACLAKEHTMIESYLQGIDLHAVTASKIAGYTWAQFEALKLQDEAKYDSIRQLGKAGNFGLLYGMGVEGFQRYAYKQYKVVLTYEEAQEARDAFFALYSGLSLWHDRQKKLAKEQKFVRSPLGRVRHLPLIESMDHDIKSKAERQAINAPVQATLSDLSLWATSIFWKKGWLEETPVVAMIHDQLLSYVPEDNWEHYAVRNKMVMESLPFDQVGWKPQLKFTVDCEIGPNLGEMKKRVVAL